MPKIFKANDDCLYHEECVEVANRDVLEEISTEDINTGDICEECKELILDD